METLSTAQLTDWVLNKVNDSVDVSEDYNPFDIETPNSIMELKARTKHYDEIFIDYYKYAKLIKIANSKGKNSYLVASTPKGIFIWDVFRTKVTIQRQWTPTTTEFEDHTFKEGDMVYFNVNSAVHSFVGDEYEEILNKYRV